MRQAIRRRTITAETWMNISLQADQIDLNSAHGDKGNAGPPSELRPAVDEGYADRAPLWLVLLLGAAAGAMGWGIRGQYGHETGAMIPGLLVGLVLVFLLVPRATSLRAARAVAMTAVAFSFGGSMTYGQTIGLTHDSELLGNWAAFR